MKKERKKIRKIKFNIIDALVILLVIACIGGLVLRERLSNDIAGRSVNEEFEIVFYINNIRRETSESLLPGENIYWKQNSMLIGKVESTEVSPAEVYKENIFGEMTLSYNEARSDLRIIVSAAGSMTESGFMLNGTQYIAPGKDMILQSLHLEAESMLVSIEKK